MHLKGVDQSQRLMDRLTEVQQDRFVGRIEELALFDSVLSATEPPFVVLHIYGPGGIGKTSLLKEYVRKARKAHYVSVYLDGRTIDPSPPDFLAALSIALAEDDPLDYLAHSPRIALCIDTYEYLTPLDGWLRDQFLPHLLASSLTVISGRNPPTPQWRTAPGWRDLTQIVQLRNLHPDESRLYLRKRNVPEKQHGAALKFTHGHPLALSLVADVAVPGVNIFKPEAAPDVVRVLLDHLVEQVPSRQHRQALEVCSHVWVTTESLLASIFGDEAAHELFSWLYDLSFIEHSAEGLFPHDVVREVLDTDLRWRHPDRFLEVHRQVRPYLVRCIQQGKGFEQQKAMYSLMYLHRHDTLFQQYLKRDTYGHVFAETASTQDFPLILDMVRRHEGEESALLVQYWLRRQPEHFVMFRKITGEITGFMSFLMLHLATPEDAEIDPAVKAALRFIGQYSPVRSGEEMIHFRFAMGKDEYQTVSSFSSVFHCTGGYVYSHPQLAWTFFSVADPEFWLPILSYINHRRSPDADFEVGGRHYSVFTHDWRVEPIEVYDAIMTERELATNLTLEDLTLHAPSPLIVLSETEFGHAVRQALRDYGELDLLASNPLMRSRLVRQYAGDHPSPEAFQSLIHEAVEVLKGIPKTVKFYRALYCTYLQSATTQEQAAELLDLPFGTYRTHLRSGVERVIRWLWQRELSGVDQATP